MDKKVISQGQFQEIEDAIQFQEILFGHGIFQNEQIQVTIKVLRQKYVLQVEVDK